MGREEIRENIRQNFPNADLKEELFETRRAIVKLLLEIDFIEHVEHADFQLK